MSSLFHRTVSGVLWTLGSSLVGQVLQYVVQLILTWLLVPEDFGLVGLATNITGLVAVVSGLGLAQALIQRRDIDQGHKDAAFWVGLWVGAALSLLVALAAPVLAWLYDDARVLPILIVSGLGFPLSAITAVQSALLRREMKFGQIARIEVCGGTVLQCASSVALALCGAGPYAIVLGSLLRLPLTTWLYARATSYRPGRGVERGKLRELWSFGGHMTVAGIVDYVTFSLDSFVLPRLLGMTALGLYAWATRLVTFPLFRVATAVTAVGFPAFSQIQHELPRMRRAYLKMVRYVAFLCFPMMAGLGCLAPEFVTGCFRAEWHDAVPVIQVLTVLGAFLAIGTTVGPVFQARARVDLEWKLNVLQSLGTLTAMALAPRTLMAQTIAVVISKVAMFAPMQRLANHLIGLSERDYWRNLLGVGSATAAMTGVVLTTRALLAGLPPLLRLVLAAAVGCVAYAAAVRILAPGLLAELKDLVRRRRGEPLTPPSPPSEPATPTKTHEPASIA